MRKISFFSFFVLFLAVAFTSCSKKEVKKDFKQLEESYMPKMEMALTANDTAEVKALAEHYLKLVEERNLDDAVGMLYFLAKDSVIPLPSSMARHQISLLKRIKGIRYEVKNIQFLEELDNRVRCKVTIFDKKPDDPRPNEINFVLRPVRRDGKWYLTLEDTMTDTHGSRIKN